MRLLYAFLFILLPIAASAQGWAKQVGSTGADAVRGTAVDNSGNVYVVGSFTGTADFDPGAGISSLTENGSGDAYVLKLDASGNFVWAVSFGGTQSDVANAVSVDPNSGAVYVSGTFSTTVDFDPGAGNTSLTSAGNSDDAFVLKLDANGAFQWAKSAGSASADAAYGVAVDTLGVVYVVGSFQSTVDFDPSLATAYLTSAGSNEIFVWKLDASGNYVWARKAGSTGGDVAQSVAVDRNGNVIIVGYFTGMVSFNPSGGGNLTSTGNFDIFVWKLNQSGSYVWAKNYGSSSTEFGFGVAAEQWGSRNIYVTGSFAGTVNFGAATLTPAGSSGLSDAFALKLDASGNSVWAKAFSSSADVIGRRIAVSTAGDVYAGGYYNSVVDLDPGAGTANFTAPGSPDAYVAKLNSSGIYQWGIGYQANPQGGVQGLALDPSGNVIIAGEFSGTVDFDPGNTTLNYTSNGGTDIFVQKLTPAGKFCTTAPTAATITAGGPVDICGSGSVTLSVPAGSANSYQWKRGTTNVGSSASSYTATSAGTYTVTLTNSCGSTASANSITVNTTNPLNTPAITPSGNQSICPGDSLTLTVNAQAGATYQWMLNGGNIGSNSNTLRAKQAGTYTISVTNICGTVASTNSAVLTVNPVPTAPTITASGQTSICSTDSVVLTIPAQTGVTYQWKHGTTNVGTSSTRFAARNAGTYTVVLTNNCGTATSTNSVSVTLDTLVTGLQVVATGPTTLCSGQTVTLKPQTTTGSNLTYQWREGGGPISGQTGATFTASAAGTYSVSATNLCGTFTSSNAIDVNMGNPTTAAIQATGPVAFCQGGSVALFVPSGTGATSFQWKKDGANFGADNDSLTVNQSGVYSIDLSNACGTIAGSNTQTVTVNPLPTKPTISQSGNMLTSSSATGNQWSNSAGTISGAVNQTLIPATAGTYTVAVTDANGCSATSDPFTFTLTGIAEMSGSGFSIYPNPATGHVSVAHNQPPGTQLSIRLIDAQGRTVHEFSFQTDGNAPARLNLADLPTGMYILHIQTNGEAYRAKLQLTH